MADFTKAELVNLRNLSLALHASAGHLITVPTDGAIQGGADQDATRVAMMAFINPIMQDIVNGIEGRRNERLRRVALACAAYGAAATLALVAMWGAR